MKRKDLLRKKEIRTGYLFLSFWIIGFLAFTLYPLIYSVLLGFHSIQITPETGTRFEWEGLKFFDQALNVDKEFKLTLGSSLFLIICAVPVVQVFALIIALMLNNQFRFRTFFRTVFFLPVVIMSGPVISRLLTEHTVDFVNEGGAVYSVISQLPGVLLDASFLILDNLVLILWFSGIQILVLLTGLQKISPDLYEAADIDGAGGWEKFWKITLPHMRAFLLLCTVYTIIDVAAYSEHAVNQKIERHIFDVRQMYSFSAAMSWIYFLAVVLLLVAVLVLFTLFGRRKRA